VEGGVDGATENGWDPCFANGGYGYEPFTSLDLSVIFTEKGVGALADTGGKTADEVEPLSVFAAGVFGGVRDLDGSVVLVLFLNAIARSVFSGVVPNPARASRAASVALTSLRRSGNFMDIAFTLA
jgi:hypothetical protein